MTEEPKDAPERIAKVLSRRGICSRREAERLIAEGMVSVNGEVLTSPAIKVDAAAIITVQGKQVQQAGRSRLWRYHKPTGLLTTHSDPKGRPTVFEKLPADLPRLVSIGRLDFNSEGLLLLTNDGGLSRALELPSNGWRRRYRVRVHGAPKTDELARLTKGIRLDGELLKAEAVEIDSTRGANTWLTIVLLEGKNREVTRLFDAIGAQVNRLIRTAYGPFQLGSLTRGEIDEVPHKVLREQIGSMLESQTVKQNANRRR